MNKVEVRRKLLQFGLKVPPERSVNPENLASLNEWLKSHGERWHWYLRIPSGLRAKVSKLVVSSDELMSALQTYLRDLRLDSILASGFVPAELSGVLATRGDLVYIEHIDGALEGILTRGGIPSCRVTLRDGSLEFERQRRTPFWYQWSEDGVATRRGERISSYLPEDLKYSLADSSSRLPDSVAVEWLYREQGGLYFIDYKKLPERQFETDGNTFLRLLRDFDSVISLDRRLSARASPAPPYRGNTVALVASTKLTDILHDPPAIVVPNGGILSHLLLRAATRGVPCATSRPLFERLLARGSIEGSLTNYLVPEQACRERRG